MLSHLTLAGLQERMKEYAPGTKFRVYISPDLEPDARDLPHFISGGFGSNPIGCAYVDVYGFSIMITRRVDGFRMLTDEIVYPVLIVPTIRDATPMIIHVSARRLI